jgi:GDP-L-fucose synthase
MRILITGSTGLLGSALVDLLISKNGFLDDQNIDILPHSSKISDLTDYNNALNTFTLFNPTHVVHLAAKVGGLFHNMRYNDHLLNENLLMNMNVLSICKNLSSVQKVLSCMSTCIFPANADLPLKVQNLHNGLPHNSNIGYAFSKRMIDVHNRILFTPDKPFLGVIPTNLFGPFDNFNLETGHVIPVLIHKCYLSKMNNEPFFVRGSGRARRQFLFSRDAAKMISLLLLEYSDMEPVILAPDDEYSIEEVARKIATIMEFRGEIVFERSSIDDSKDGQIVKTADGSKFFHSFPDFSLTSFDIALQETIVWFIENYEICRK